MTLKLVSAKTVPVTLQLAKRFRDMTPLKNERVLKPTRSKDQLKLILEGNFFPCHWGECELDGVIYRGNGNHTSNLLTACIQNTLGQIDDRSVEFVKNVLMARGPGLRINDIGDLPEVREGKFISLVEKYTADDEDDLVTFFLRYDSKGSVRSQEDRINIRIGEHRDLDELDRRRVGRTLGGVAEVVFKNAKSFGVNPKDKLSDLKGADYAKLLRLNRVRELVKWIILTVPNHTLYTKQAGSHIFSEIYVEYGPEDGAVIIEDMMKQIENEEDPASKWEIQMNRKKRGKTTGEYLINEGRKVVRYTAEKVLEKA